MNETDPTDPGPLPAILDRNANLSPKQKAEARQKIDEIVARERAAIPVMPKGSTPKSPLAAAQAETRKEKARVRVEKMLAKKAGETAKLPPTGRAALALIQADKPKETKMRMSTETTPAKGKLAIPPPKSRKSVLTPTGKAALREEAAKAVAKNGITKIAPGLSGRKAAATAKKAAKAAAISEKAQEAKKAKPARATARTAKKAATAPRSGTKQALIGMLLRRPKGCTSADVLEATGWPAVSMPQQAEACNLKLRREKRKGEPTRYFGS